MNIKIIILIVLIIILIIIGCWYIINLYNKEKSKNDDEPDTNFWKTYGGEITYTKDETKAIIPISDANKNTFLMPKELFIDIVKFLNTFDENYNKILKSDDKQNKINELWILKYKLNIYKSELKHYKNNYYPIILYSKTLDNYNATDFLSYNNTADDSNDNDNTQISLSNFKQHIISLKPYKYIALDKDIYNNLKEICNIQNQDNIEKNIDEVIKLCKDKDTDTKTTIITVIINNFINQIQPNTIKLNYWNQILLYGFFLSKLIKHKDIFKNLKNFILILISCSSPLLYSLYPNNKMSDDEYKIIMRYKQKEDDEQYEKRIISTFKLLISFTLNASDSINNNINDTISYINTLINLDYKYKNIIGKVYNLPLEFCYISTVLISKFIENNSELYKQINNKLKKQIEYYSKAIKTNEDKRILNKPQKLLSEKTTTIRNTQ